MDWGTDPDQICEIAWPGGLRRISLSQSSCPKYASWILTVFFQSQDLDGSRGISGLRRRRICQASTIDKASLEERFIDRLWCYPTGDPLPGPGSLGDAPSPVGYRSSDVTDQLG
jgi:hypothetical protein